MKVPMWQVHGSWATAIANGLHEVTVPVLPDHGADARRNRTHVLSRHSLARFHADWDRLLKEVLA